MSALEYFSAVMAEWHIFKWVLLRQRGFFTVAQEHCSTLSVDIQLWQLRISSQVFVHCSESWRCRKCQYKETRRVFITNISLVSHPQVTGFFEEQYGLWYWTRTYLCVCVCDGAHPWQLAHSSSSIETSSKAARVLRVTTRTSCPLPSHAPPAAAAVPDLTTPASGPHHTPLSTGAMTHHSVGQEDIGQVPAVKNTQKTQWY